MTWGGETVCDKIHGPPEELVRFLPGTERLQMYILLPSFVIRPVFKEILLFSKHLF